MFAEELVLLAFGPWLFCLWYFRDPTLVLFGQVAFVGFWLPPVLLGWIGCEFRGLVGQYPAATRHLLALVPL